MGLFRTLVCTVSALIACQFPAFESLYENRLQARLDESRRQILFFEAAAKKCSYSLDSYIAFFENQPQIECQENGRMMRLGLERHRFLKGLYEELSNATYPYKIALWVSKFDYQLSKDTLEHYRPSLVLDRISGSFALLGAVIGYIAASLLVNFLKQCLPKRKRKLAPTQ